MYQGFAQPTIPNEQANASDIKNSLHSSRFAFYLGQSLQVGLQHPDQKRKMATAFQDDQKTALAQEFASQQMQVNLRHYPTEMTLPKKTSIEYKREAALLKDNFDAKRKLIERMTKMMHDMIDLSEEHAFLCEIPGWSNQTYLQNVHISRQAEPYFHHNFAQLHPPVSSHAQLPAPVAPVAKQLTLTDAVSAMSVAFWDGTIQDCSSRAKTSTATTAKVPIVLELSVSEVSPSSEKSSESEESSESEDEWMTVYRKCFFSEVGGDIDGIYYETYGGGPQGGFVETADLHVFKVSRTWFQAWEVSRLPSEYVLEYRQSPDCSVYAPECRIGLRHSGKVEIDPEMQRRLQCLADDVPAFTSPDHESTSSSDDSEEARFAAIAQELYRQEEEMKAHACNEPRF